MYLGNPFKLFCYFLIVPVFLSGCTFFQDRNIADMHSAKDAITKLSLCSQSTQGKDDSGLLWFACADEGVSGFTRILFAESDESFKAKVKASCETSSNSEQYSRSVLVGKNWILETSEDQAIVGNLEAYKAVLGGEIDNLGDICFRSKY